MTDVADDQTEGRQAKRKLLSRQ